MIEAGRTYYYAQRHELCLMMNMKHEDLVGNQGFKSPASEWIEDDPIEYLYTENERHAAQDTYYEYNGRTRPGRLIMP